MADQWPLRPIDYCLSAYCRVDLVISKRDARIPPSHARRLVDCFGAGTVSLVEVDADHVISDDAAQYKLALQLLASDLGESDRCISSEYC